MEVTMTTLAEPLKLSKRELDRLAVEALAPAFNCPKCGDAGYLLGQGGGGWLSWITTGVPPSEIPWCDCEIGAKVRAGYEATHDEHATERRQRRLRQLFERASVPARFQNFTLDLPAEHANRKRRAYAACRMMIKEGVVVPSRLGEYDPVSALRPGEKLSRPDWAYKSLTLSGPKGAGKTVAMSVVFRHFLEQGVDGLWIEWYDFVLEVQSGYGSGVADQRIKAAQDASVILLDDLGDLARKGKETDDRRRILWQVLGHRHSHDRSTLVTTNLDESQLRKQFDGRIIDRLLEMSFFVPMNGQNLRVLAL
jgi:DNA replication protein DnaC